MLRKFDLLQVRGSACRLIALDKATPAALQAHLKAEIDKWGR